MDLIPPLSPIKINYEIIIFGFIESSLRLLASRTLLEVLRYTLAPEQ